MTEHEGVWAPIEGVGLDEYAFLVAGILARHLVSRRQVDEFVESRGVPPGAWTAVEAGWVARIAAHRAVRARYALIYATASGSPISL